MINTLLEKPSTVNKEKAFILWFEEVGTHDGKTCGGASTN
jgi:hypothetical protein